MKLRSSKPISQLGQYHRLRYDVELALLQLASVRKDDAAVVSLSFGVLDHILHTVDDTKDAAAAGMTHEVTLIVK